MNDAVMNRVQDTEQQRHTARVRALIGECGETSYSMDGAQWAAGRGEARRPGQSLTQPGVTGRAGRVGLSPSWRDSASHPCLVGRRVCGRLLGSHSPGGVDKRGLFCYSSGGQKSVITGPADLFLLRALSLACRWPPSGHVLTWPLLHARGETLILWEQGPGRRTSFNLNDVLRGSVCKCSHTDG